MTIPEWVFKPQQPGDTTRDPISGEFFATEAIRNSAEALVREGIQNSLDASQKAGPVRVRIHLSAADGTASAVAMRPLLAGIEPHLLASGNGLRHDTLPQPTQQCRFLVFEDFGTRGLEGDPDQWHKVDGRANKFYAFFRAEGESDKTEADRRGRWGVGKFVFPRASMGSTFFGLTIRADDRRQLLLGRSILKSHAAGGIRYVPDGYFGITKSVGDGRLIVPVEAPDFLDHFRRTFDLRRTEEPGLSLVVPWYDPEITADRLLEAAIRDWFFSILSGELEVTVGDRKLDSQSLEEHVGRLSAELRGELDPLLSLTRFALSTEGLAPTTLAPADTANSPRWHDAMLADDVAIRLRTTLDAERPIAVRIPIKVKRKRAAHVDSWLDIFLVRDSGADDGRPVFVREGVIVSDAKGGRARGYRSLAVINDSGLADLLGDAENPAHTEWRADTGNFKEKYTHGPGYLTFVKQSVAELINRVQATEDDTAPDLLIDLFSLPESLNERLARPAPGPPTPGRNPEPLPDLPLPRKPAPYRVTRVAGGFTLTRGSAEAATPAELIVTVAYDVRRGNPFRKYDPADFRLFVEPVLVTGEYRGLDDVDNSGNSVHLKVTDPDFRMTITGFDTRRDLIVRVVAKGEYRDDQAA